MEKVSKLLKVYKTTHHDLGEIIEMYSPVGDQGKAFFIEKNGEGKPEGVGIRLSKKTALKLGTALLKLAKEKK